MNIQALKAGVNCRREITFPGTDEKCFLHLLSDWDEQQAEMAAQQVFSTVTIAFHNSDDYNGEKVVQKLYLALRDADGKRLFSSAEDFKKSTTRDQQDVLMKLWGELRDEHNPSPERLDNDQFSALVDEVKKKPEVMTGNISSIHTLRELVKYLVWEQSNSPTDNGSTFSPSKSSGESDSNTTS